MFYSAIVRFYAKKDIYFKRYPAESIHGMLFKMLKKRDAKKATILHDDYESKPFTISPMLPYLRWRGKKKYLKAGKKYYIKITFLEDEWYRLFMEYFLYHPENLRLNGTSLEVIEVLTNSKENKQCNCIEAKKLRENAIKKKKIRLKFHSTTTFRENGRHIILPKPDCVFNSLLTKWNKFGDSKLSLNEDDFDKIFISRYKLETMMEQFKSYPIKGFKGHCEYEVNLTGQKLKDINLMADFAFYSGVGYKTTMGLGQVSRDN